MHAPQSNRRDFFGQSAALAAGFAILGNPPRAQASPNEKLNIAVIGIGGRGEANLNGVSGENIVALCDVDEQRGGKSFQRFPQAKRFTDYRRMFDSMANQVDAVVVSTPDHTHFHPAMIALSLGKHLYCEKPMAHSVDQARRMTELAASQKVATQLGVQRHTISNVHRVVEFIQSGRLGEVRECHAWIGGNRGMPALPTEFPPVPDHLDWNLWLGQAEDRRYSPEYVPYKWRFWWDFGTGETGNWGCHVLDIPYWALGLSYPTRVDASGPEPHSSTTPKSMATRFQFPAEADRGPVTLHWHHTKNGPEILAQHNLHHYGTGVLFVGSEGMLLTSFSDHKLYPEDKFADVQRPDPFIPDSPGFHREWIDACKGGPPATCDFSYSGPLSETVLLGNAAFRAEGGFQWQAETLTATGNPRVAPYLESYVRKGWEI